MAVAVREFSGVECEVVTNFSRLESIAADWHRLWMVSPHSEVFHTFGWARASWKAFADQMSLFTPVVYRGSEVIGILPLALSDNTLQFLGSPLSDYNDVICEDENLAEVMAASVESLLKVKEHWKTCKLDNVPAGSRLACHLPDMPPSARRHFRTAFRSPCPTIVLDRNGDMASKLARKESLRRHEKNLRKLGQLTFKHLENREDIARHLSLFFDQHIGRRAILGQTSHFLEARNRKMFEALVEELNPRGLLRFAVLSLDDRPIAYHFGFHSNGKFLFYQPAFDIDYWRCSPGEVLLRRLLLYAQEHKVSEFDFTRGGEAYKDRFATHIRDNLTLFFNHNLGFRRRIQVGFDQADGGIRKSLETLRKHPPAYRFVRITALRSLNLWRRELRLIQHDGARYSAAVTRRVFRNFIIAWDTRLEFSVGKQEARCYAGSPGVEVSVGPASLSELALVSVPHPDVIPCLREFQDRLAAGQQIYLVRESSNPAQVWIVTTQRNPPENEGSSPNEPMLIVEQSWTARWFCGGGVFKGIFQQVCDRDMDILINCREHDQITQEMRSAGLQPSRRAIHFRLLHWFWPVFVSHAASLVSVAEK